MALLKKTQPARCSFGCIVVKWLLAILFFIAAVAALIGVYMTHVLTSSDGSRIMIQFGSGNNSLAIIAFCVAAMCWFKQMCNCMEKCDVCSAR